MKQHEHLEQVGLFRWAALNESRFPELKLMFAIPNGGHRDIRVARKLKAEGVKRGVPDIFLPAARGNYNGLFIELKAGKNKLTKEQEEFIAAAKMRWYQVAVAYSWFEAAEKIERYLTNAKPI